MNAECNIEATDGNGFKVSSGHSINGHIGQSYTLTCSCQNVNQAVTFEWKKNNTLISGKTESTLTLSQLKLSDAGRYSCSIMLSGEAYGSNIDVNIQSKSEVTSFSVAVAVEKQRRFSVHNLMFGVQLADASTRCSSHPQGTSSRNVGKLYTEH